MFNQYAKNRNDSKYLQYIRSFLQILSINQKSIIDIGSNGVDILSDLDIETKVSFDLVNPCIGEGIESIKADFLSYEFKQHFDICLCLQVLEHIDSQDVEFFSKKLLALGKIIIISVPYRWEKSICKYHKQDPVTEDKIVKWFGTTPFFAQLINDNGFFRAIYVYLYKKNNYDYFSFFNQQYNAAYQIGNFDKIMSMYEKANFILSQFYAADRFDIDITPDKLLSFAKTQSNKEVYSFLFELGMNIYPLLLDKYGHPIFLKEYIRLLLSNNFYDEAKAIYDRESISRSILNQNELKILFTRAENGVHV